MIVFTISTLAMIVGFAFVYDGKPLGWIPALAGIAALILL